MGKPEIQPLATPKSLNRSSPKVAHVIISWISTKVQNLVAIPQGLSFPVCAKSRIIMFSRLFFWGGIFLRPTAEALELIHTEDTSNDADLGLENTKKNNITFKPPYSRKTAILGPTFDGT